MNIYVGNLAYNLNSLDLKRAFEAYGRVESAEVITDRRTGRSRGYGFVSMPDDKQAQQAIERLNGHELGGRPMRVDVSKPGKKTRRGRPQHGAAVANGEVTPEQQKSGGLGSFIKRLFSR